MMVIELDYGAQFFSSSWQPSRRCLLWQSRPCWFLFMAYLVLCFPVSMESCLCLDDVSVTPPPEGCIFCGDYCSSQSFAGHYRDGDVSPCFGFSFQSTFLGEADDGRVPSLKDSRDSDQTAKSASFKMANGEVISCSLSNSTNGIHLRQDFVKRSLAVETVDFCEGSLVPDIHVKDSCAPSCDLDEHLEEAEVDAKSGILIGSSSLPEIELLPATLDWGTRNIYSPSLAFLKVINKHNVSVLDVYDLYSTNIQFSAYSFQKLSVSPGESASISFVFLPRWLGSSSAQLVLQTSFGGFVIHAKGRAAMSPYQLQSFVGFNISTGQRMSEKLSVYNPFIDVLYVKEVATWISISGSKKNYHSAHVSCKTNRFQKYYIQSDSSVDGEWFSLKNDELGSSRVDFRPHQQWEVPPYSSKAILELNLWPRFSGKVHGAICIKLGNSLQEIETLILPIDIEVRKRESYTDPSGYVSLHFDTLSPCHGKKTDFFISLRNNASYLLKIVKIYEETVSFKIFEIRYMEGLLLFPGTITRIALITFNHPLDSDDKVNENHSATFSCMFTIITNDSVNPEMYIPCHDLVLRSCIYQSGFQNIESECIKVISKDENQKCASIGTLSLGKNSNEELSPCKSKALEITESDDILLEKSRSHATTSMMSVLEHQELLFPMVQVGSHHSKWISVHNPSQKPIVMQLVLNSEAIVDHCKCNDDLAEHTFESPSSHIDSAEIKVGFSMAEYAITEAFVHPLESALLGPVIFRPSNRCMWRSSAFLRNNLSSVEWLRLEAFGGSHALAILEDSVPVHRLDFDLRVLKASNISFIECSSSFCSNIFTKDLYAKNTGELPLEIIELKISGIDCSSDGFNIHGCEGFSLAPGESRNLLISYQSDFSTSVVHRDLELSTATGILVIPMKASIPACILNSCRKAFFRSMHWKLFLLLLLVSLIFHRLIIIQITAQFNAPAHQDARNPRYPESPHDCKGKGKKKLGKECFDHDKRVNLSTQIGSSLGAVPSARTLELPENCNLTVRVVKYKGRRRRKPGGAGLAAKLDVSGSQSGNSTPSSPLSPNVLTPKQVPAQSPDSCTDDQSKELNNTKRPGFGVSNQTRKAESAVCSDRKWSSSDQVLSSVATKMAGKPSLFTSATFPGPGVAASSFFASTSSIAPCARAPGSKLCKEEAVKGEVEDAIVKDFTYDIWGNHFSEHMFCRPKETMPNLSDASEGDSYSFFTSDPQSPMMMSVASSASPGLKTSPDVNCL